MATPRTSYLQVVRILDTDVAKENVEEFINTANLWVTANLAGQLSDDLLTQIELYLAAHFVTLRDPRMMSSKLGDAQENYQRNSQMTEYLQTAAALDSTGTVLDSLVTQRRKVNFRVGAGFDDDLSKLPTSSS